MEKSTAISMFKIIECWLSWDECGLNSYYEYEKIKNNLISNETLSFEEKQKAYSIIQTTRYYFNANVDNPRNPDVLRRDAYEFDSYYKLFLAEFYTKSLSNPENKYSACYIASAVYGSYNDPQVMILRRFRDLYLHKRSWGRRFIEIYYKFSPSFAEKLKQKKWVNNLFRCFLDALIIVIKKRF